MRAFIILCCLVTVSYAGNGYFYGPGISGSLQKGIINKGLTTSNGLQGVGVRSLSRGVSYAALPEEETNVGAALQLETGTKKNLMVMFIKDSESVAAKNAALKLANNAGEEIEHETIIYLLAKQTDTSELLEKLQQLQQNVAATPEVRIIKYRTPEQLAHAVKVVQSQYDGVGGPSTLINGGVVPVINYGEQSLPASVNFVRTGFGSTFGGLSGAGVPVAGYGLGSSTDNNFLRKYR